LAIAFRHAAQFAPDASFEYSNTNYAPLGLIAEKVSYASFAGGAISTADDLATWMEALVSGKVFGTESHISASVRTRPCITTVANFRASTRSWAMTRITM
jgi:CubicO group peptidase (beta-lactamase class C family)